LLFFGIFFSVYGLVNFYIGYHGWRFFKTVGLIVNPWVYWPIFWFIALSYILSRAANHHLPNFIYEPLHIAGAYWLGAMMYFFLFLLAFDGAFLAVRFLRLIPAAAPFIPKISAPHLIRTLGPLIITAVFILLAYGSVNARRPVVTRYEIDIPKKAGNLDEIRIAMVSDIHLGSIVNGKRLAGLVERVNKLKPDLILLPGDVLDEDLGPFIHQNMDGTLRKFSAPLGVFAVPGNHEYIGRRLEEFAAHLANAGIKLLIDDTYKVADSFYIVGRDDLAAERFGGKKRMPLGEITAGLDKTLPLLLMDHQPYHLEQAESAGIDLQVSGHTHRGQLWPGRLVTSRIYELDYGLKQKGGTNIIVSSGYGTWGPPIRIGNKPEIVEILVKFTGVPAR
jgi:hypothetical protein